MPCAFALQAVSVPARKWTSRVYLVESISSCYEQLISAPIREVSLSSAAQAAGLSQLHFQRLFRTIYGISPTM